MKLPLFPPSSIVWAISLPLIPHVWCSAITYTEPVACGTLSGLTRVTPVKTTTVTTAVTATAPITATTTITPSVTTTKTLPATIYITTYTLVDDVTTTIKNTMIDTFTSTTTLTQPITVTNTVTVTASSTITDTITASASTVTIPTSPGFTPASSAAYLKKRDPSPAPRHDVLAARRPEPKGQNLEPRALYPTQVLCAVLLEVVTTSTKSFTAPTTTITSTTGGATLHSSTTTTVTVILTTLASPASTTIVVTTSIPITTTVPYTTTTTTYSTTSTTTTPIPSTYYAACSSDNLLYADPLDGGILGSAYSLDNVIDTSADSEYDCCVLCFQTPGCGGGYYQAGFCELDIPPGTCDPTDVGVEVAGDEYSGPPPAPIVAFDGNCGQVQGT